MSDVKNNTNASPLKHLYELKKRFGSFLSTDRKLEELREHFAETLEYAQKSFSRNVNQNLRQSLKKTFKLSESQKNGLDGIQKRINPLLRRFSSSKKKVAKAGPKQPALKKAPIIMRSKKIVKNKS